jgi:hypothetical protein
VPFDESAIEAAGFDHEPSPSIPPAALRNALSRGM